MIIIHCSGCGKRHEVRVHRRNLCPDCLIIELEDRILSLETTLSLRVSDIQKMQVDLWKLQKQTNKDFKSIL